MGEIVRFPRAAERHKGKTLCRHGHHKWRLDAERVFDVKRGRLVTRWTCVRCGAEKVKSL